MFTKLSFHKLPQTRLISIFTLAISHPRIPQTPSEVTDNINDINHIQQMFLSGATGCRIVDNVMIIYLKNIIQ